MGGAPSQLGPATIARRCGPTSARMGWPFQWRPMSRLPMPRRSHLTMLPARVPHVTTRCDRRAGLDGSWVVCASEEAEAGQGAGQVQ
jgi:hypothetical protein